jgi:hypothetical protein
MKNKLTMTFLRHSFTLISILIGITSCDLLNNTEESKSNDVIKIISNIPDSNWESIIVMSSNDALCINLDDSEHSEMLAVIDNDFDIRMIFDKSRRPISLTLEGAEFHAEYHDDSFDLIYTIDGVSGIDNIPTKSQTKATGEEAFDFAVDVTKSEIFDKVVDKVDDKIEEKYGKTTILGNFMKFIDLVNTLRELDDIDNALELVDYLESSNDIVKFIDLIKTRPNHKQGDYITYAIGLIAGDSEVEGAIATLTLEGTIRGESKGKEFNFEYGLCYSSSNDTPVYSDRKIGKTYSGLLVNPINITLPEKFKTVSLEKGTYYYRGYFKDNDTGNIIYSDNVEEFEIEDDRWVDLGLPSGILWAKYNVGATSPEEYGGYYAWGETETKSSYSWENYKYGKIHHYTNEGNPVWVGIYLGDDISQTQYDVAHIIWGEGARMPNKADIQELLNHCAFTMETLSGILGAMITGPNSNYIFLPFCGRRYPDGVHNTNIAYYWTSSYREYDDTENFAYTLYCGNEDEFIWYADWNWHRNYGQSIRPVKDK